MRFGETYIFKCRAEFDDCDPQKIMYHPQIIKYMERARFDAFEKEKIDYDQMLESNAINLN